MTILARVFDLEVPASATSGVVSGLGFPPVAVLTFSSREVVNEDISGDFHCMVGATTGQPNQWCIAAKSRFGQTATVAASLRSSSRFIQFINDSNARDGDASILNMQPGGFTFDWVSGAPARYKVQGIAIGGSGVKAAVGTLGIPTVGGSCSVTGLAFQPDTIILAWQRTAAENTVQTPDAYIGLAFACDGSESNTLFTVAAANIGRPLDDMYGIQLTSVMGVGLNGLGTQDWRCTLASYNADGFTLTIADNPAVAVDVYYLALNTGGAAFCGHETQKTSAGTKATTGVGFTPGAALFAGSQKAASSSVTADANLFVGAQDKCGNVRGCFARDPLVGTGTSTSRRAMSASPLGAFDDSPAWVARGAVQTFDSNGFTVAWSEADATAREFFYLVFESECSTGVRQLASAGVGL